MASKGKAYPAISVVVPVYNEERNISPFLNRLIPVLSRISKSYEVIFVLDPSKDKSEIEILHHRKSNSNIKLLLMSRRFGQPSATMAGLRYSLGNRVVVIDVDLQDPPEIIEKLNNKMDEGYDVVYATRESRAGENIIKKAVASIGYKLINSLSEIDIPKNTGDFRIMSRDVVKEIVSLNEKHGFLRGLVAYVGFEQTGILYDRDARFIGKGNYNRFLGSLKIGLNGLIGFSSKPLSIVSFIGAFVSLISFLIGFWYLLQKIVGVNLTPGLSTTIIVLTFFAGVQLFSLGLLGQYISRIYDEVKSRPAYIIRKSYGLKKENDA